MKRQFDPARPELMDRPQPLSAELERDLRNLRQLNRYFGSHAVILRFMRRWLRPGDHLRIVDLARKIGAKVQIDALDRQAATLEIAAKLSVDYPEISCIEANILEWRPAEPYEMVLCSLALHHFSNEDAV